MTSPSTSSRASSASGLGPSPTGFSQHTTDRSRQGDFGMRLRDNGISTGCGQLVERDPARRHDDRDDRIPLLDMGDDAGARHIYVGEDQVIGDVGCQQRDRFVGAARLEDPKTGIACVSAGTSRISTSSSTTMTSGDPLPVRRALRTNSSSS